MSDRIIRCRYMRRNNEQCTAEAVAPDGDVLLCTKHLARALEMVNTRKTAEPAEPMGTGHRCTHCNQRINLEYDRANDVTHWVHDRTGENHCADRAISARPMPEPTPWGMAF